MFRYEMHMHTKEASACAWDDIHDMLRRYARLGYAGVVVTNHFIGGNTAVDRSLGWKDLVEQYSRPYYDGQETARQLGIDLLFGIEEGYGGGKEFLVYGVEPGFLLERPFLRGAGVEVWSREVHSAGGVLIYAHPFRQRWYIAEPDAMPDLSLADGVELCNLGNDPAADEKARAAFGGMDMIHTAGSDIHNAKFDTAWGMDFPERIATGAQLAAALKRKDYLLAAER